MDGSGDLAKELDRGSSLGLEAVLAPLMRPDALARARALAAQSGDPLDAVCTRLGLCTERELVAAFMSQLGLAEARSDAFPAKPVANEDLNPRFLRYARIVPLSQDDEVVRAALVDPTNESAVHGLELATRRRVERLVCSATDFESAWDRLYGRKEGATARTERSDAGDLERLRDYASDAPVIRYVNQLLARAIDLHASDIHFEPVSHRYRVRLRLDGLLQEIEDHPAAFGTEVVSRLKIMARLNIAERRLAQDGRFRVSVRGQDVDLRMATTPTVHGEAVVLRILDRDRVQLDLSALGFSSRLVAQWTALLNRPHGILLVTGPTGSGKSTTLYASLVKLNRPERKLLTIEDPVEQQIEGLNQVHAQPAIGFGFGAALRAFLRHDPDVIMVGEVRDQETARTAIQAALTGHLILSTLHTNDAVSGITRLLDMGIDAYLIAATVHGILAQRLVRKLCPQCRGVAAQQCETCGGSGYRGRVAIGELLVMSPQMRALVEQKAGYEALRAQALEEGMAPIARDGEEKVALGVTSAVEIARVALDSEA